MSADERQEGGSHYASKKVQPWSAMEAWMTREQFCGFLRGNAIQSWRRRERIPRKEKADFIVQHSPLTYEDIYSVGRRTEG